MGKKKRESLGIARKDDSESMMARARRSIAEAKDNKRQEAAYRTRMKYASRWMEETEKVTGKHCKSIADVDLTIPQIHLEWLLCDPVYALKLKDRQVAYEFFLELNEEERELFWYRDEAGHSYSDLMMGSVRDELKKIYKSKKGDTIAIGSINTAENDE